MRVVIAGDLGGINGRWQAYTAADDLSVRPLGPPVEVAVADVGSLLAMVLLADQQLPNGAKFLDAEAVCLGAAGVWNQATRQVALPHYWDGAADVGAVIQQFDLEGRLIVQNDFVGEVYALRTEVADTAQTVIEGRSEPDRWSVVIGPGTGLGQGALSPDGEVVRSEGGNAPLGAPWSDWLRTFVRELLVCLDEVHGITSPRWEDLVSGSGLSRLYEFFYRERISPAEVSEKLKRDEAPAVARAFAELLALKCREVCYTYWPPGAVYLSGGVLKKNPFLVLGSDHFAQAFRAFPVARDSLEAVSVRLITDPTSGLHGCAARAAVYATLVNGRKTAKDPPPPALRSFILCYL